MQDPAIRSSAEAQIRRRGLADMRSNANPVDGPPFRVTASCPTLTGGARSYTLDCRATAYERPKAVRGISGVPLSLEVASERWSVRVQKGRVSTLTRARGMSIGRSMTEDYNLLCGDGSSSSGDPACH